MAEHALAHVDIVLVRPQQSGNVGAAARAVANHGLGQLVLVDPPSFDPDEARWMAPHARHVVDGCRIVGTLSEAVADRVVVVGTSGRPRRATTPVWGPGALAERIARLPSPAAVVFGPEDAGLSNEDLAVCTAILTLPTSPVQPSLNLGQAVTVTGSWMLGRVAADRPDHTPSAGPTPAPVALRDAAIDDAMQVLGAVGYLDSRSPVQVRGTLHEGLARIAADARLVAILRGMLKPLKHRLRAG